MIRNSRVYIADVLDQVVIQATVWTIDAHLDGLTHQEEFSTTIASEGVPHTREWLRDALIGLVEDL